MKIRWALINKLYPLAMEVSPPAVNSVGGQYLISTPKEFLSQHFRSMEGMYKIKATSSDTV
jgi:hypothetical protein